MNWQLVFTRQARKDANKVVSTGLKEIAEEILRIIEEDPFKSLPPFKNLVGDLAGACSRRINIQHRLVYQVIEERRTVKVIRMWSHYE